MKATTEGDARLERMPRRATALATDIVILSPVGRAASMTRTVEALSGPGARAAMVVNPRGALYANAHATALAAGLPNDVVMLYAGAEQAGLSLVPDGGRPSKEVMLGSLRKRLRTSAADKRKTQIAKISGILSVGVSARVYVIAYLTSVVC